jgi:Ribbon-helix-helix protein, copG family
MTTTTITLTDAVARRVAALAAAADQPVEEFIERVLRGLAEADVDLEQGLPVFRMPADAPRLTSAEVDRLLNGHEG